MVTPPTPRQEARIARGLFRMQLLQDIPPDEFHVFYSRVPISAILYEIVHGFRQSILKHGFLL